jgi:hypothetical protein
MAEDKRHKAQDHHDQRRKTKNTVVGVLYAFTHQALMSSAGEGG